MKKSIKAAFAGFMGLAIAVSSVMPAMAEEKIDTASMDTHKIGVAVYNIQDEEVISFREYLENYIAVCFPDVQFVYSDSLSSQDAEMEFIQNAADAGVEGILSFLSYDLEAEVDLCAQNEIYYMEASGSVAEEDFQAVEDNEYFIGAIGPGTETEYQAGYDMGTCFAEKKEGNEYFILSGGSMFGVDMHLQRVKGILDALQESYGVSFDEETDALAASAEVTTAEAGDLKVCIAPGYLDVEDFLKAAQEGYQANPYGIVLGVLPIGEMLNTIQGAHLGLVDCYSTRNLQLFADNSLEYVCGKYSSIIGPSFAAMYNAVCGYAADFRDDGKAFEVSQGFWTSQDRVDFEKKYVLSSSMELNAYSAEDLTKVCKVYNPDATFTDLMNLASECTYEDAVARRGL